MPAIPQNYKHELERMAALTPAEVQAALQRWLTRPEFSLAVVPGERTEDGAQMGGWGDEATSPAPAPDAKRPAPPLAERPAAHRSAGCPRGAADLPGDRARDTVQRHSGHAGAAHRRAQALAADGF